MFCWLGLQLRTVPGAHELVWIVSFISFFFLYPSTFNLLEVAAVDKPKLHMWETGILRITRHPQVSHAGRTPVDHHEIVSLTLAAFECMQLIVVGYTL